MAKKQHKKKEFEGIGLSEYETDMFLRDIPIIMPDDTKEMKAKKQRYIKRKLASLRNCVAR